MISLAAAMRDPNLLGQPFQAESFWPWHTVAKVISGEPLDARGFELFCKCTGRTKAPAGPVTNLTLLVGRRGGKDRFASAVAVHRATLAADWRSVMSSGEQAAVIMIGADKKQARILRRYCGGFLEGTLLGEEVTRQTEEVVEFRNGAMLEVVTNDASTVRGRSAVAILGTECAFWRSEEAAKSNDEEVVAAAEPSMAMVPTPPGAIMIMFTSVSRKSGYPYRTFEEWHGNDDVDEICWHATSRDMNPSLSAEYVAKYIARDPPRYSAEFNSVWREDASDFIPGSVIDQCTDRGVEQRAPIAGVFYHCFVDASGGTGKDSFTAAIAHAEKDGTLVLDRLLERQPPFVPSAVIDEFAAVFNDYRIRSVIGDRYSVGFHAAEWQSRGFKYLESVLNKSEIYLSVLPKLTSIQVRLLDNKRLRSQFTSLERRVYSNGREGVDHPDRASAHDDLANAAAGALTNSTKPPMTFSPEALALFKQPGQWTNSRFGSSRFGSRSRMNDSSISIHDTFGSYGKGFGR